jgi:hypothetical protein
MPNLFNVLTELEVLFVILDAKKCLKLKVSAV